MLILFMLFVLVVVEVVGALQEAQTRHTRPVVVEVAAVLSHKDYIMQMNYQM
jgi:hypothetical protein